MRRRSIYAVVLIGDRYNFGGMSNYLSIALSLKWYLLVFIINPLSPHDASKHHFTSLKTDLIFLQLAALENFHEIGLPIHGNFPQFLNHTKSSSFTTVENCDSNSRLVVDEDDNGEFRLQRVNPFSSAGTDFKRQNLTDG